jgi:hypothetical protein
LRREHQDRVDVNATGQCAKTIDGLGTEVACGLLGPHSNLFAHSADFEAVVQGAQRGPMSHFPGMAQTDKADAKLHDVGAAKSLAGKRDDTRLRRWSENAHR